MPVAHPTNARFKDLTGQRFGRLIVVEYLGARSKNPIWKCRCDCGGFSAPHGTTLLAGRSKSCGCLRKEITSNRSFRHGMLGTRTYFCYLGMLNRCNSPTHPEYRHYGGRGIKVDPRWRTFAAFLADMGVKPNGMSIDRIDNDGNYEPGNCRWATLVEQANNKRNNHHLTHLGRSQTVSQWAVETGIKLSTVFERLKRGWSVEKTLTTPVASRIDRLLTYNGKRQKVVQWERELGFKTGTITTRLVRGWSDERALSTPVTNDRSDKSRT